MAEWLGGGGFRGCRCQVHSYVYLHQMTHFIDIAKATKSTINAMDS